MNLNAADIAGYSRGAVHMDDTTLLMYEYAPGAKLKYALCAISPKYEYLQ